MDNIRVFFDENDTLKRVMYLYGKTQDSFYISGMMCNSIEHMLELHLLSQGYELVLFYNGVQNLYCFSQEMAEKRDKYFNSAGIQSRENQQMIANELDDILGIDSTNTDNNNSQTAKAPLRLQIDDLQIGSYLDKVMRTESVRTAVVFTDGWDLLNDTSSPRTLCNRIISWYHLGASNKNIAIICFDTLSPNLIEYARNAEHGQWMVLADKMQYGNSFSDAVVYLSMPEADEIEGRLRQEQEYIRLDGDQRLKAVNGARRILHKLGNTLKGLDNYLRLHPDDGIHSLLGDTDDEEQKAFDRLNNTKGWEGVAQKVKDIAQTVKVSGIPESTDRVDGSILRMTSMRGFLPTGVCINLVLKGNPGTGKTTIAECLGKIYRKLGILPSGHVVRCARDDLVGRYIGHTAANTRAKIEEAMGGILFLDEAYTLFRDKTGDNRDFGIEAIDTLVEAMTRSVGSFAVVLAGYPDEMDYMLKSNPGLLSRFGNNIVTIEDYPPELLQEISTDYLHSKANGRLYFDESLLTPSVTGNKPLDVFFKGWFNGRDRKHFGNARDCRNLVDALVTNAQRRRSCSIVAEDFPENVRMYFKEADLDINSVLSSLDCIVGQDKVKKKLLEFVKLVRLRNKQQAVKPDNSSAIAPGHYLFVGNPGTGKTTIAEKFAQVLGALRITGRFEPKRITGAMLLREFQNGGISAVREVIESARGGVLFVDESHQLLSVPMALQLLLDPMIEMRNELCVILACYSDRKDNMFSSEPGLESRISDIFEFEDYTAEKLVEIFRKKVQSAGYVLADNTDGAVLKWMEDRLSSDVRSQNGRYAEHLLSRAEANIARRLADNDAPTAEELFTITTEDIK